MKRLIFGALALFALAVVLVVLGVRRLVPEGVPVTAERPLEQPREVTAAAYSPQEDPAPRALVDLEELRAELPDNLYWSESAPTDDLALVDRRHADKARRNDLYGKILSGGATRDEIDQYYAYRERVSRDYIVISQRVLERYGDTLSEEERGLYELSINMHGMRLQELPRAKSDAYARKAQQETARAAWNDR